MRKVIVLIAFALSAAVCYSTPSPAADKMETAPAADNSKMNKEHSKALTADQQSENKADLKITQNIRRAVMKDKSLSQYAHNVKIITRDGAVTLKGPVRTEKEKKAIEKVAARIAGKENVTSELQVTTAAK
jgi:hyperosmotically inducible periplasmic protein